MHNTQSSTGIKLLAVLLSVVTLFTFLPLSVFAAELSALAGQEAEQAQESELQPFEITELREENVKYFQQPDGTRVAAMYTSPVHYEDENGVWQDIDNTLTAEGSEYVTPTARVKFAKKITGNSTLFTLHEHNKKITMSLNGAKKRTKGTVNNTLTSHAQEETQLKKRDKGRQMTLKG